MPPAPVRTVMWWLTQHCRKLVNLCLSGREKSLPASFLSSIPCKAAGLSDLLSYNSPQAIFCRLWFYKFAGKRRFCIPILTNIAVRSNISLTKVTKCNRSLPIVTIQTRSLSDFRCLRNIDLLRSPVVAYNLYLGQKPDTQNHGFWPKKL